MTEILIMAKDPQFRVLIREECIKQEDGDYDVTFKKIIDLNKDNPSTKKIEPVVAELRNLNNGIEPIIFYPRAEVYDDYRKAHTNNNNTRMPDQSVPSGTYVPPGIPTTVYQNSFYPDYSTDGYAINSSNYLTYSRNVNEDWAWENDVWVVGYGENCSSGNMVAGTDPDLIARVQGQSERGMIIYCTNLNAIEPWTAGKLEFKYTVLSSTGATILGPLTPGRFKRSNFKNKWCDFNKFIGNWNTSTFGNWMYENWIEEDGGTSNSYTITQPPPSGQSGPTISTTIPSKDKDDVLGTVTVQFTDAISQIYNISYANVKHKN